MTLTTYSTGTISVSAASTAVTGSGTSWSTAGVRAGDLFTAAGLTVRIASINSNTSITLSRGWPGSTLSGQVYDISLVGDAARATVEINRLLQNQADGNNAALAALEGVADRLAYFTGPAELALTTISAYGRSLLDDTSASAARTTLGLGTAAVAAVVTGSTDVAAGRLLKTVAGPAQAFRRGNVLGTVSQSSGVPTGALIERASNANGEYTRFADGTQICRIADVTVSSGFSSRTEGGATAMFVGWTWTFPATFAGDPGFGGTARLQASGGIRVFSGITYNAISTTQVQPRAWGLANDIDSFVEGAFTAVGAWF